MEDSIKKAAKAGVAYTVGNVLLKGISFLTLPLFSRMLTTKEYGFYTVYVSYETILTIFVGLCLYGALRTGKYDYRNEYGGFVSSVLTLSSISFVAILAIANVAFPLYEDSFEFDRVILNVLLIHSYAMFVFQFFNTYQALGFKYKGYLIASGINAIGGTALSILLIVLSSSDKHIARIIGYAIVPILVASYVWVYLIKCNKVKGMPLFNRDYWKYALRISSPLVIHTFSLQILNQFDRIMINKMVDTDSVGIYGFIHTIANILHIIVLSMDNAWSAWMYEQMDQKQYTSIKNRSVTYILIMNVLYVGFVSLAPEVIRVVGPVEYHSGAPMIVPMAFAIYFIFLYSLPVHVEYFHKKTIYIAIGTGCAAVVNFVLNYIFIKMYGYQAAAWTTLVSYALLFIFHFIIARLIEKNSIFPMKMVLGSLLSLVIISCLNLVFMDSLIIRWSSMILYLVISFVIFKDRVISILIKTPILGKVFRR